MRDKQLLKVAVPISIATALQEMPQYKSKTITQIIKDLTLTKLRNSTNECQEQNENINYN